MNRIITSIVILSVMAAGCFWTVGIVDGFSSRLIDKIDEVEQAFIEEDTEKSVKAAMELQDEWHKFMDYSVLVNDLGHALEITSAIAQICSFAEEENEELYAACDCAQELIGVFRDTQMPTVWKVL